MINLSRVVHSPLLSQPVTFIRTSGRWVQGQFQKDQGETVRLRGIVTVAKPDDLNQVPEADRQGGGMKVLTTARIYETGSLDTAPAADGLNFADVLVWRGQRYKVVSVAPDADYGFYRSICTRLLEDDDGDSDT